MIPPHIAKWVVDAYRGNPEPEEAITWQCHYWGDDWPHWDDLYAAERHIRKQVRRWSRCHLVSKEKYGSIRYEYIFPPGGALFFRNKLHWWWLESWVYHLWEDYGRYVADIVVRRAAKKWPQCKNEILEDWEWF